MGAVAQFSAAQFRSQNPHLAGPTYAFLLQTDLNLAAKRNYFTFSMSIFTFCTTNRPGSGPSAPVTGNMAAGALAAAAMADDRR